MKQSLTYKLPFILLLLVGIFSPFLASTSIARTPPDVWSISTLSKPLLICTGTGNSATTVNGVTIPAMEPCKNLCDLVDEFINVVYIMIAYAIWIIAPVAFIAGGIMYMLSGANPGLESKAKDTLKGAVIGVIIVLCSYIIILTFVNIFSGLNQYIGGFGTSCTIQ